VDIFKAMWQILLSYYPFVIKIIQKYF